MVITADRSEFAGTGDLLTRAQAEDTSAFCHLAAEHERRLLQQACGLTHDPSAAEDLVSETLVEAWRSLSRYNGACRFSTWLFSILLHRHQKALRRACNLPWAIRFPEGNPLDPPTYPVHPTEIYESLLSLALYAFLAWLFRRRKFDGQVFGVYLVSYALLRSFVEMFRGDYPQHQHYLGGWATPAHLVSILILAAGLVLLRLLPRPEPKRE
jgi:hypothetical protein